MVHLMLCGERSQFIVFIFLYVMMQLPLPEPLDTEDASEITKWKWKVKGIKKENAERHSKRCDIELKLAVIIFLIYYIFMDKLKPRDIHFPFVKAGC